MRAVSKNAVVLGLVLLSLTFTPLQSEGLSMFRVTTLVLSFISFGVGLTLTGWALGNNTLTKCSKVFLLEVLVTSLLLLTVTLRLSPYDLAYLLTQAVITAVLINFLILYTYSWYLFRRVFKSARNYLFTITSSIVLTTLSTTTYTLPQLVPAFIGITTSTHYEQYLTYYYLTSLIAFPTLLMLSILYLTLPDF
ncbi:MAG: hypothetical protein QXK16_02330 [Sulfolobales archaeon]